MAISILGPPASSHKRNIKVRAYMHMDKWALVDALEDAGYIIGDMDARDELVYAFYEVEVDAWVNLDTGEITLDGCQ